MSTNTNNTIDLANRLNVTPEDIAVYVDQLVDIDGLDAVIHGNADDRTYSTTSGDRGNELLSDSAVDAIETQLDPRV